MAPSTGMLSGSVSAGVRMISATRVSGWRWVSGAPVWA